MKKYDGKEDLIMRLEGDEQFYDGVVYYDIVKNKFVQIRKKLTTCLDEGIVCSHPTDFYRDARTSRIMQWLTTEYIADNLVAIDFSNDRKFYHNGIGWCIRK